MLRETVFNRVKSRVDALGLTISAVERMAFGANGTIRNWKRPDKAVLPRMDTLEILAPVLKTSAQWLMTGEGSQESLDHEAPDASLLTASGRATMAMDVPVLGTAAGSYQEGAFQIHGGVIDYVRRPPSLINARDLYALYVEGSSMEPQFFPGDLIYLSPHKKPRHGDIVVAQCKRADHEPIEATLGVFLKKNDKALVIGKRNPEGEKQIDISRLESMHRVLSLNELLGV